MAILNIRVICPGRITLFFSFWATGTVSDSIHFNVCDCDSCMNECCTYLVVVTFNVSPVIGGITLSAIVTENGCEC
ncbi:DUF4489 domain-containing protein [Lacrimispora indolis]|uniref:DUF4489 domain-containing protein n=1 Tax=Lacrimispora indolis TaxID=69825 RepID=UPI0004053E00